MSAGFASAWVSAIDGDGVTVARQSALTCGDGKHERGEICQSRLEGRKSYAVTVFVWTVGVENMFFC